MNGHDLMKVPFAERLDLSSLHEGMYIILITINGHPVAYNKLIKIR
jgi:hypothetical protein